MASSMRTGRIGLRAAVAESTSRRTMGESLASREWISRTTRAPSIASMMASAQEVPATMLRGAIQHAWPRASTAPRIASASSRFAVL